MGLMKEIYKNISFETIDFNTLHTMETEIYALAKKFEEKGENERKDLNQLLIEASTYGQETGFIIGFRYAVKLLAECYY